MQMEEILNFETFEVINGKIYTQIINKNMLCRMSPEENRQEMLNKNIQYRFKHCTYVGDKLYFADNLGKALLEYDIKNDRYETYEMDCGIKADNNIAYMAENDGYVFIISQYKGIIFVFDSDQKILEHDKVLGKRIESLFGKNVEVLIRAHSMGENICFFVNSADSCYVCKYNMKSRRLEEISGKLFQYSIRNIYYFQHEFYILQDDFTLCIWNTVDNKTRMIEMTAIKDLLEGKTFKHTFAFSALTVTQKNIWLFPAGENDDIYIFNLSENTAYRYDEYPPDFYYLDIKWSKYADMKERDGRIYVAARMSNYYLMIDVITGQGIWKSTGTYDFTEYYREHFFDLIGEKGAEKKIVYEESYPVFQMFLQYQSQSARCQKADKSVGQVIWETLK